MLVRSAFSANIKERRDCSTALFDEQRPDDRAGRAHPRPSRRDARRGRRRDARTTRRSARSGPLNDPYAGGTHLPDITLVSRTAGRLRRHARTSRRRRRPRARLDARGFAHARGGGRRDPADPARRRRHDRRSSGRCAIPRSGAATCARSSPRTVSRSSVSPSSARGAGTTPSSPRWTSCSRTRSAGCAPASRRCPTGASRRTTCSSHRRRPRDPRRRDDRGRRGRRSTSPERPRSTTATSTARSSVARSACFYVVRVLVDPDLPASGGAFAPVTVRAPEGCLVNARPPAAVAAGNVETSSRIVDVVMRAFGEAIACRPRGRER